MGMALKSDVVQACQIEGSQKPIDLVYLSSQTMGDRALESEILGMFAAQLPQYAKLIETSENSEEMFRAAHTLKGAARSVGAFQLAELSAEIEQSGTLDVSALQAAVTSVCEYIAEISQTS